MWAVRFVGVFVDVGPSVEVIPAILSIHSKLGLGPVEESVEFSAVLVHVSLIA